MYVYIDKKYHLPSFIYHLLFPRKSRPRRKHLHELQRRWGWGLRTSTNTWSVFCLISPYVHTPRFFNALPVIDSICISVCLFVYLSCQSWSYIPLWNFGIAFLLFFKCSMLYYWAFFLLTLICFSKLELLKKRNVVEIWFIDIIIFIYLKIAGERTKFTWKNSAKKFQDFLNSCFFLSVRFSYLLILANTSLRMIYGIAHFL